MYSRKDNELWSSRLHKGKVQQRESVLSAATANKHETVVLMLPTRPWSTFMRAIEKGYCIVSIACKSQTIQAASKICKHSEGSYGPEKTNLRSTKNKHLWNTKDIIDWIPTDHCHLQALQILMKITRRLSKNKHSQESLLQPNWEIPNSSPYMIQKIIASH